MLLAFANLIVWRSKIRHESNQMRLKLPPFLHWSPSNTHPSAASLHLEFLYQDFLLYQTVAKRTGKISHSLIETSQQILALLLELVSKQVRTGRVNHLTIFDVRTDMVTVTAFTGVYSRTVRLILLDFLHRASSCCRLIERIAAPLSVLSRPIDERIILSPIRDYSTSQCVCSTDRNLLPL
jgi:hypothetical protein